MGRERPPSLWKIVYVGERKEVVGKEPVNGIFLRGVAPPARGAGRDSDLPPMPPWTPYTPFKRPRDTPGPPLWRHGHFPLSLDRQGPHRARTLGLAWGQQPIGCRGGHAPCMAPVPGRVPLRQGIAVAAPCHHSKDHPAPWSRGRDQLRQAAGSRRKADTRVAKRLGFHEVKANLEGDSGPPRDGREPQLGAPLRG